MKTQVLPVLVTVLKQNFPYNLLQKASFLNYKNLNSERYIQTLQHI